MPHEKGIVTIRVPAGELLALIDRWYGDGWEDIHEAPGELKAAAARAIVRIVCAWAHSAPRNLESFQRRFPDWALETLALWDFPTLVAPKAEAKALQRARAAGVRDGRALVDRMKRSSPSPAARKRMSDAARKAARRRKRGPGGSFAPAEGKGGALEPQEDAADRD